MTIDLSNPDSDLVSLLEIEIGHRIDEDAWINVGGDNFIYVADTGNNRIKKHLCTDLTYDSKFGAIGAGDDQFSAPRGICSDGIHLYIVDTTNNRIKKHKILDFSFVGEIGTVGAGNDQFNNPEAICTDGTHLYIADRGNSRIKKHKCSDLSYVAKFGTIGAGNDQFDNPWKCGYSQEGYPNLWYITHPEGEPSKVEQCFRSTMVITTYTERATLVLCDANPSSWFWDSVNNRLYLHTSGSDAPDTAGKYLIMSYFWDCFCNKQAGDIVFETIAGIPHFYLPYLDDTIPSIRMETSGYHEGGTRQTFGTISVINADGYFDTRLSDYIYEAKKIRYLVGERGDIYADYIVFWRGWTGNIGWSDEYVNVGIDDLRKRREY